MENTPNTEEKNSIDEKKRINDEKKKLKEEEKKLKREIREAKAREEDEDDDSDSAGGFLGIILMVIFLVLILLALLCICIRLDVGGFGSGVLKPILKGVPGASYILPVESSVSADSVSENKYYGYKDIYQAVDRVKALEQEIDALKNEDAQTLKRQEELNAQITRLQEFEKAQTDFQNLKNDYYDSVVFSGNAMTPEEYSKYYSNIDAITGEEIYRKAAKYEVNKKKLDEYAKAYAAMKPAQAAAIFEAMKDDMPLVARILKQMGSDDRGAIIAAMDPAYAASITEIMEPR